MDTKQVIIRSLIVARDILKNYSNITKSLKSTQNYYNETKSFKAIDIKEFSFLYILLKKPELIKDNFNLIENVKLFSSENKLLLNEILSQSKNFEYTDIEKIKVDQNLIARVLKYAGKVFARFLQDS